MEDLDTNYAYILFSILKKSYSGSAMDEPWEIPSAFAYNTGSYYKLPYDRKTLQDDYAFGSEFQEAINNHGITEQLTSTDIEGSMMSSESFNDWLGDETEIMLCIEVLMTTTVGRNGYYCSRVFCKLYN